MHRIGCITATWIDWQTIGSFEDIFDRSVSHQAIYKKGMAELKSAQDETSIAEAALESEKKETTLLRAKLAKQTADIQLVATLRTERDETKVALTKVRDDEEKLRVMITPLESKVRELSAATEALTIERNAVWYHPQLYVCWLVIDAS